MINKPEINQDSYFESMLYFLQLLLINISCSKIPIITRKKHALYRTFNHKQAKNTRDSYFKMYTLYFQLLIIIRYSEIVLHINYIRSAPK